MAKTLRRDLLTGSWPGVGSTTHADGSVGAGSAVAGGAASAGESVPRPRGTPDAPPDAAQFQTNLARAGLIEVGDRFVPARAVWEHFGVTAMSLHRWLADEKMKFPRPTYLGRFRYWRLSGLLAWEATRPTSGVLSGAAKAAHSGELLGAAARRSKAAKEKKAAQAGAEEAA
jgi:hypothetical protein